MKRVSIIVGSIILFIIMVLVFETSYRFGIKKSIKIDGLDTLRYIEITKEVCDNKFNLNWKEIAAIAVVENNNSFLNIKNEDIEHIAKTFIKTSTNEIFSLEEVLKKLNFTAKEKRRVYKYIEDIKNCKINLPKDIKGEAYQISFIDEILEGAISNYEKYNIMPSVTIAQAIIESDWGKSELAIAGNNLFGIKADGKYKGETVTFKTKEFYNMVIDGAFRKYKNKNQSIEDHGTFLNENERYKDHGFFKEKNYRNQCLSLENAGYSTVENYNGEKIYADVLIELIENYKLYLIDIQVENK
ncbi:glucosaminidase domain-containing protein [Clostridium sp. ATCC 25772]|uniref:glycoside hydrolase family 73 protein n=1 Tax=Clostridium sp. ATCC 25772 TaxID=1676991 RepID=UPI0007851D09|nr:glucosaminidase domain-containing protein [Clostridium sp. ATCC 25772]